MALDTPHFFGTDGIRGRVGTFPITADFMVKFGWAVGSVIREQGGSKVVLGKDTRLSGYMIESALEAGLAAAGIETYLLGPMPTPAIAHITRAFNADLGIVISASHNSYEDNGVKLFTPEGFKISRKLEQRIEERCAMPLETQLADKVGRARRVADACGRYVEFCKSSIPHHSHLRGFKIVVDCANGAAYKSAPLVFSELGAEVIAINAAPNGMNINLKCGSQHPEELQKRVLEEKADVGIALDGDADRLVMVDEKGQILDGDELLYIMTRSLHDTKYLQGGVVGTVMSNQGLQVAIKKFGLEFIRVAVGDQNILRELVNRQWSLGGEPSGHIIYLQVNTTADGVISALQILQFMNVNDLTLSEARKGIEIYPQKVSSVRVSGPKINLENGPVGNAIEEAKTLLGKNGRVLVRYSGTEPLIRIMVEGEDKKALDNVESMLSAVIKSCLCE